MFSAQVHKHFYYGALLLFAASLPFSIFTLSVAHVTLIVNWILEGKFKKKLELAKKSPSLWVFTLFYLVHILWMMHSPDISTAMHELSIKLPMLMLPIIISTSESISENKLRGILNVYLVSVLSGTMISAYTIFGLDGKVFHTIADYSRYVYHIQWSIMVVIAIFIVFHQFGATRKNYKWLYIPLFFWFVCYIFMLQALTGIVIFIITSIILLFRIIFKYDHLMLRWFSLVSILTIILLIGSYLSNSYASFHSFDTINTASLEKYTASGALYTHDVKSKLVENGHYVNLYVCESELEKSWNKRSKLRYDGLTYNGEQLKRTLSRYLTSKGVRKDSVGMSGLSNHEISFIELGKTNYIDTLKFSLRPRIYVTWWELYNYSNGGNPSGYSVVQRLEALKTAFHIIGKTTWFGVGTGAVVASFVKQYEADNSSLSRNNRIRTHNQFVTYIISFGIIGFLLISFSLIVPALIEKKYSNYLLLVILLIMMLSFLDDDTLELIFGISLFAFFYSLFLFSAHPAKDDFHE